MAWATRKVPRNVSAGRVRANRRATGMRIRVRKIINENEKETRKMIQVFMYLLQHYLCTYNVTRTTTRHDGRDRSPIRLSLAISSRALKLRENQNKRR